MIFIDTDIFVIEKLFKNDERYAVTNEFKSKLDEVLSTLNYRESQIIRMRYGLGGKHEYTYEELGKIFSISTDIILKRVGKYLADKYMAECSPEEFLGLFCIGDASSKEKLVELMMAAYESKKK